MGEALRVSAGLRFPWTPSRVVDGSPFSLRLPLLITWAQELLFLVNAQ